MSYSEVQSVRRQDKVPCGTHPLVLPDTNGFGVSRCLRNSDQCSLWSLGLVARASGRAPCRCSECLRMITHRRSSAGISGPGASLALLVVLSMLGVRAR